MAPIPFAFSVHHFITSVGSDAGFAAIIGLAVLVLLYFAQARETASLRDQADESSRRVQTLESRIMQLTRQPPAGAPAQAPTVTPAPPGISRHGAASSGARAAAAAHTASASPVRGGGALPGRTAAHSAPGAPAGMAAPALSAATRLIPTASSASPQPVSASAPGVASDTAAGVGEEAAGGSEGVKGAGAAASAGAAVGAASEERPEELTAVSGPAPVTVAGAANGAGQQRVAPPHASARQSSPGARVPLRPAGASSQGGLPPSAPHSRSLAGRGVVLLVGAAGVAAVVAVLLIATSGGGTQSASSASSSSNASVSQHHKAASTFNPSSVTVSVLNGTATTGLAHRTATRLSSAGYKEGTIATASDQTLTSTVVAYMPGHRSDAVAVARSLKLGAAAIQPVDSNTQAVACPPPSACSSTVVVTVGADLASG